MPRRDFNARMFVPTWSPPSGVAERLDRVWWMTSKHIVHMSRDRAPESAAEWQQEDTSYRALMRINRDAYAAFSAFVEAYAVDDSRHAPMLRDMLRGASPFSAREASILHGKQRKAERRAARYSFPDPYASVWWG